MPRKHAEHCNAECCRAWISFISLPHRAPTEMQNLQPCGDQQTSAESRKEKLTTSEHLVSCQKNTCAILKNLLFECLKTRTCFENSISSSNLAIRYDTHDPSRETWRGKMPCFPLKLLHLLKGEAKEKQCESRLVSWHSHLDHARKFLWVSCEFYIWWSFPIQLALHSDFFSLLFIGKA